MTNHIPPRRRVTQGYQSSNLGSCEDSTESSPTQTQTMTKKGVKNPFTSREKGVAWFHGKRAIKYCIPMLIGIGIIIVFMNMKTILKKNTVSDNQKDERSAIKSARQQRSTSISITKEIRGNNFTMNVYEDNDIVSNFTASPSGWEPQIIQEITNTLQTYSDKHNIPLSDLTFVDIGANIGWFTMNLAAFGANVIAFEPMQDNIDLIQKSLEDYKNVENGVSGRVKFYPHGLGTKDEVCVIYSHNINVGDGHVKCVDGDDGEKNLKIPHDYSIRGRIPVHRLDDVVDAKKEGLNIVVIKMDTEGYESNVLEGGSNLFLRSGARVILTEFAKEWMIEKDGDPVKFMKDVSDAGYRLKRTNEGNVDVVNPQKVDKDFMTKEEMVKAVGQW